jgi:hypothetical protein
MKNDCPEAPPPAEKQKGVRTKNEKLKNFKEVVLKISFSRFSGSI